MLKQFVRKPLIISAGKLPPKSGDFPQKIPDEPDRVIASLTNPYELVTLDHFRGSSTMQYTVGNDTIKFYPVPQIYAADDRYHYLDLYNAVDIPVSNSLRDETYLTDTIGGFIEVNESFRQNMIKTGKVPLRNTYCVTEKQEIPESVKSLQLHIQFDIPTSGKFSLIFFQNPHFITGDETQSANFLKKHAEECATVILAGFNPEIIREIGQKFKDIIYYLSPLGMEFTIFRCFSHTQKSKSSKINTSEFIDIAGTERAIIITNMRKLQRVFAENYQKNPVGVIRNVIESQTRIGQQWCVKMNVPIAVVKPTKVPAIEILFPQLPGVKLNKLKVTDESLYSVTPPAEAEKINRLILRHVRPMPIIDGTANAGGNTIGFSRAFPRVFAVEMDNETHAALKNNVRVYQDAGYLKNVTVIHSDILEYLPKAKHGSILFLDPPWGGISYKYYDVVKLSLSGIQLHDIVARWKKKFSRICMKVPFNYDIMGLFKNGHEIHVYSVGKYRLIIV